MLQGVGRDLYRQERPISLNNIIHEKSLLAAADDSTVNRTLLNRVDAAVWPHPMKEAVTFFSESLDEAPAQQALGLRVHVGDRS